MPPGTDIHPATRQLLALTRDRQAVPTPASIAPLAEAITYGGTWRDADALLPIVLAHKEEVWVGEIWHAIAALGNESHGNALSAAFTEGHRLKPGVDESLLEALGRLQVRAAYPMLWDYALQSEDYCECKHAVLGLLHTSDAREEAIAGAISNCMGKHLFAEFVPALVCKLHERASWLSRLYELGNACSTDCNAGIVLAFSLCAEEGRPWFLRAITDPDWEADEGATGTLYYAWAGMKNLRLRFAELAGILLQEPELRRREHGLSLTYALLSCRIHDADPQAGATGTRQELLATLFSESENSLYPLATSTMDLRWLRELQRQVLLRLDDQ